MGAADSDHDDNPGMPPVAVPDDASSLEPDRQAWLSEIRQQRRKARMRRMIFTRRWDRFGLSGPLVIIALLITSVFGGLAVYLLPRQQQLKEPRAAPLAGVAEVKVASAANPAPVETSGGGVVDHRLPAAPLEGDVKRIVATDLRPAVIVLVPTDCECTGLVKEIYRQALEFRLPVWLVSRRAPDEPTTTPARGRLSTLDVQGAAGGARWAVDSTGMMETSLVARGATVIAVRADGEVAGLRRDLPLDPAQLPSLEPLLATLIKGTG
jgi:hypothetical protein